MAWDSDVAFLQGLEFFSGAVRLADAAGWDRPTPCEGWRALDVLGHVGSAVSFGAALLRGDRPAWEPVDPPGQAVTGAPATWWEACRAPAVEAVGACDLDQVVDSPMGRRSVREGLGFPAVDLFLHAWDLARSAGGDVEIPDEAVRFTRGALGGIEDGQLRGPRVFGPAVAVAEEATPTEALVGWSGRDPTWSLPA